MKYALLLILLSLSSFATDATFKLKGMVRFPARPMRYTYSFVGANGDIKAAVISEDAKSIIIWNLSKQKEELTFSHAFKPNSWFRINWIGENSAGQIYILFRLHLDGSDKGFLVNANKNSYIWTLEENHEFSGGAKVLEDTVAISEFNEKKQSILHFVNLKDGSINKLQLNSEHSDLLGRKNSKGERVILISYMDFFGLWNLETKSWDLQSETKTHWYSSLIESSSTGFFISTRRSEKEVAKQLYDLGSFLDGKLVPYTFVTEASSLNEISTDRDWVAAALKDSGMYKHLGKLSFFSLLTHKEIASYSAAFVDRPELAFDPENKTLFATFSSNHERQGKSDLVFFDVFQNKETGRVAAADLSRNFKTKNPLTFRLLHSKDSPPVQVVGGAETCRTFNMNGKPIYSINRQIELPWIVLEHNPHLLILNKPDAHSRIELWDGVSDPASYVFPIGSGHLHSWNANYLDTGIEDVLVIHMKNREGQEFGLAALAINPKEKKK